MKLYQAINASRERHKPFRVEGDIEVFQVVNFGIAEKIVSFIPSDIPGKDQIAEMCFDFREEWEDDDWEVLE